MDAATFLIQVLNGVQYGMLLFLVASGLTLIFGVMKILNVTHGSFYAFGAYGAATAAGIWYERGFNEAGGFLFMIALAMAIGLVIGFYDGLIGPGTGTFLVITLVTLLGYDFLQASAKAKIVNLATNFGALLLFVPHGAVLWLLGSILAVANIAGSYLGSRMAISRGSKFIRIVFLVVVILLIGKLGVDVWNENISPALGSL